MILLTCVFLPEADAAFLPEGVCLRALTEPSHPLQPVFPSLHHSLPHSLSLPSFTFISSFPLLIASSFSSLSSYRPVSLFPACLPTFSFSLSLSVTSFPFSLSFSPFFPLTLPSHPSLAFVPPFLYIYTLPPESFLFQPYVSFPHSFLILLKPSLFLSCFRTSPLCASSSFLFSFPLPLSPSLCGQSCVPAGDPMLREAVNPSTGAKTRHSPEQRRE